MTVYGRTRWYTTVYDSRIAPYTEQRTSIFNHSVFLHDLRIRNPFLTVSHRIRCPCTVLVYDLRISPFFSVNGRLRPCLFDLGKVLPIEYKKNRIAAVSPRVVLDVVQLESDPLNKPNKIVTHRSAKNTKKYSTSINGITYVSCQYARFRCRFGFSFRFRFLHIRISTIRMSEDNEKVWNRNNQFRERRIDRNRKRIQHRWSM
jgi:hypothetical protein